VSLKYPSGSQENVNGHIVIWLTTRSYFETHEVLLWREIIEKDQIQKITLLCIRNLDRSLFTCLPFWSSYSHAPPALEWSQSHP